MLEILALYFLCKRMGDRLRAKGWTQPIWMQIAVVVVWVGGMLFGSFVYGVYLVITKGEAAAAEGPGLIVYPIALLSAAVSVGTLFLIVAAIPGKEPPALPDANG